MKQQKTITDGTLLSLNKLEFPFEFGNLNDNDDISSSLITRLYEYSMRNLNLGPIHLTCIQEDIYLKVDLVNKAKGYSCLGT